MDMNYRDKVNKNYIKLGIIISIFFIILLLRLYYLQIYNHDDLSAKALDQRGKEISLDPRRGIIFDRNKKPLTNNEIVSVALIEKSNLKKDNMILNKLKENTVLSEKELNNILESDEELLKIPLKDNLLLEEDKNNLFIVDIINRYSKDNPLSHVLGYVNKLDNKGETGIEKVYDEYLKTQDKNSFIIEYDKDRSLILNGEYYVNQKIESYEPEGVKLTIDYKIQNIIENIMDDKELNGAVIVSESETGEILGMASRPNYNQDRVEEYFTNIDMSLYNKAIQVGYPPGSLYKIVVLLTALEQDSKLIYENYLCEGFEDVNGVVINCNGEHGWISLERGFAVSCNSLFIQMAKKLGAEDIINMSESLGLGNKINIGLLEEEEGYLPNRREMQGAAIGNIAIGQNPIEVTPLQMTNLISIIVNNGVQKPLSLVKGITNKNGYMIKQVILEDEEKIINKSSAEHMKNLLGAVVSEGTGQSIKLEDLGGSGGKTGSSEAVLKGKSVVHGWFVGFYPFENPEYIITVLIEDTELGSRTATPIFEAIAKEIYNFKK